MQQSNSAKQSASGGCQAALADFRRKSVLSYKIDHIASQLTLINAALFRELQDNDLSSLKWYHPRTKQEQESDRVTNIARRFNYEVNWAIRQILQEDQSCRRRAEVYTTLSRLAKRLYELNNFDSSFAIVSALQSNPIIRLEKTRKLVPRRDQQQLKELEEVYSQNHNWHDFRQVQEAAGQPCVPHIGFYKTDLIHVYHATPSETDRLARMRAIEKRVFALFERSNYGFLEEDLALQGELLNIRYLDELQRFVDDENMSLSKSLEPDSYHSADEAEPVCSKSPPPRVSTIASGIESRDDCASIGALPNSTSIDRVGESTRHDDATLHQRKRRQKRAVQAGSMSSAELCASINLIDDSAIDPASSVPATDSPTGSSSLSAATATNLAMAARGSSLRLGQTYTLSGSTSSGIVLTGSATSCSRNSSIESGSMSSSGASSGGYFEWQGVLRWKHLVRDGQVRRFATWKRYWVGLCNANLVFFQSRTFSGATERRDFRNVPSKSRCIAGWHVERKSSDFSGLSSAEDHLIGTTPPAFISCDDLQQSCTETAHSPGSSESSAGEEDTIGEQNPALPPISSHSVERPTCAASSSYASPDDTTLTKNAGGGRPASASALVSVAPSSSKWTKKKTKNSTGPVTRDERRSYSLASTAPPSLIVGQRVGAFKMSSADRRQIYLCKAPTPIEANEWIRHLLVATTRPPDPNLICLE